MSVAKRLSGLAMFDRERADAMRGSGFRWLMAPPSVTWLERHRMYPMPFGKYRGEPVCAVPSHYLEWVLRKADIDLGDDLRRLMVAVLEWRRGDRDHLQEIGMLNRKEPTKARGPQIGNSGVQAIDNVESIRHSSGTNGDGIDPPFVAGTVNPGIAGFMGPRDLGFVRSVLGEGWPYAREVG